MQLGRLVYFDCPIASTQKEGTTRLNEEFSKMLAQSMKGFEINAFSFTLEIIHKAIKVIIL